MPKKPKIEDILDQIAEDPESASSGRGATEEAIEKLERELGLSLPPSYTAFLRRFDGGEFKFGRMLALNPEDARYESIRDRLDFPGESAEGVAKGELIPVGDDYSGQFYCLDYRQSMTRKGEVPVVLCPGDQGLEKVAKSFLDLIAEPYLELTKKREAKVVVSGFKRLPYGSWIDLPELAPYGIRLQLLDPEILGEKHNPYPMSEMMRSNGPPPPPPGKTVAFSLYNAENGSADIAAFQSKATVRYGSLSVEAPPGKALELPEQGSQPRRLVPGSHSVQTVYHLVLHEEVRDDAVLKFTVDF